MTVMEAQESPLLNVKLQRKLPVESIQIELEELRKKGNLEWFLLPDHVAEARRMGEIHLSMGFQERPEQLCVYPV